MNTKVIRTVKHFSDFASKNSSTILTWLAVSGVISTVLTGMGAAVKADRALSSYVETLNKDSSEEITLNDLTKREVLEVTWKIYLPTVILGAGTAACIIGANRISLKRNAALASVYSITDLAFREYREKVAETIGKNKEQKVRDDISKDKIISNPVSTKEVIITGKGEVLCYDSLSGRYFKSDVEKIRQIINNLNQDLPNDKFITLNNLYYELGLGGIALGDEMGWSIDRTGIIELEPFSATIADDGTPCLVLNYYVMPKFI